MYFRLTSKLITMKTLKRLLCLLLLTTPIISSAQNREITIKSHKITNNIYMLTGSGGNIGLSVGEDGVFMIDDQFAPLTEKILAEIKTLTDKPVRFLINTHWHGDHTGGNENMTKKGTVIVAHENVRKRMSTEQFNTMWNRKTPPSPKGALPVVTFDKSLTFHLNGEDILVFHVHNAHTDGDAMIYFSKSNVLHTGDTYFQGKYPYIDLDAGGSVNGYIKAIKHALNLIDDETKIIPGHRNISNKKELQEYVSVLESIKSKVIQEIANGKTEEEVTNNASLTKEYDDQNYGDWFIKPDVMRKTFYRSLKDKKE